MDSDEYVQEEGNPSTSSDKGPPPIKRAKPLTAAAERKRRSREAKSADKKREELVKNQERIANQRRTQSADEKKEESINNQERMANKRRAQSADKKKEESDKNQQRMANQRAGQSSAVRSEANAKVCEKRQKARTKVNYKEGLRSQEIMDGSHLVTDLENSDEKFVIWTLFASIVVL